MSYVRFSDTSDVYLYPTSAGRIVCCACILGGPEGFHSADELVDHLRAHVAAGNSIPAHLLDASLYEDEDFVPMQETK